MPPAREPLDPRWSRRRVLETLGLMAGASFLSACAAESSHIAASLPKADSPTGGLNAPPRPTPSAPPPAKATALQGATFPGVRPRTDWSHGEPDTSIMNPMLPVRYVTVHHDGLDRLEMASDSAAMAERIELYRVGHRARGWGDIGYHFVIDRAGVVWEARSLQWQGAHVKDRNEGNVGILVMGNFEVQRPTPAQLAALRTHLYAVCAYFSVPWTRVFSHREWPGAQTLCPGQNLQVEFVALRNRELRAS
ncbi:MAG: N-acetylmuramoyl-L-alanine amidase [Phycisphaerae bacterium]|nr:N-acetylmuramoyl-L-alanine amidase [Phycisphaerae bacterium]